MQYIVLKLTKFNTCKFRFFKEKNAKSTVDTQLF